MQRALFIVDVQNDFTEGGALGVDGGAAIAAGITRYLGTHATQYDRIVASRDWHDGDGTNAGHFAGREEPNFVDTWPVHCVAETYGAEYHPAFDTRPVTDHIFKGRGEPGYSIFDGATSDGATVRDILRGGAITDIDVVGLATDYCVRASALDALQEHKNVRVLSDLVAGISADSAGATFRELEAAGARIEPSDREARS